MKTKTKAWLIAAAALVLVGCVLFALVMTAVGWNFSELSTAEYEDTTHVIIYNFDSIAIHTDTADIAFARSDSERCKVECHEEKNATHSVTVENGTLTVSLKDERSAADFASHFAINTETPKITVFLTETAYRSLLIREETGDVEIPKDFSFQEANITLSTGDVDFGASVSAGVTVTASTGDIRVTSPAVGEMFLAVTTGQVTVSDTDCQGAVNVDVSTGKATLSNVACQSLTSTGSTGEISLTDVIARETFSIERSTGDIRFDRCDAASIDANTDTGSISGSLLSEKVFIAHTDTGSVDVPKTVSGGTCELTSGTGDIKIRIA